jgi:hypothetical protein
MINLFKSDLRTLTAALTLGTLSIGFAPAAMAVSTYDATASFSLTLTDVTDMAGATVTSGWSVEALGDDFGGADLFEFGDASASGTTSVIDPAVSLNILDWITQTSTASGTATNGDSWTDALTDLNIFVDNFSNQGLTFSFSYDITAVAMATGDEAQANATVDMLDDLGFVDILAIAAADTMFGPASADDSQMGSFQFTLEAGQFNNISGIVDSFGSASAVPVPAAVWLFGSGLLGLVGVARRKHAA